MNSFQIGFIKRAKEYGLSDKKANDLLDGLKEWMNRAVNNDELSNNLYPRSNELAEAAPHIVNDAGIGGGLGALAGGGAGALAGGGLGALLSKKENRKKNALTGALVGGGLGAIPGGAAGGTYGSAIGIGDEQEKLQRAINQLLGR